MWQQFGTARIAWAFHLKPLSNSANFTHCHSFFLPALFPCKQKFKASDVLQLCVTNMEVREASKIKDRMEEKKCYLCDPILSPNIHAWALSFPRELLVVHSWNVNNSDWVNLDISSLKESSAALNYIEALCGSYLAGTYYAMSTCSGMSKDVTGLLSHSVPLPSLKTCIRKQLECYVRFQGKKNKLAFTTVTQIRQRLRSEGVEESMYFVCMIKTSKAGIIK